MVKEKGLLNLPDSKTGAKTIYLSDLAVELLRVPPGKIVGSSSAEGRSGTSRSRACRRNGSASERPPAYRMSVCTV